ncbi:NAD(P)-binding domain-containing protein [Nitrososphaera sp.]|uniref:NAD(P)-binding domain-containing protein n=1 Tax=Nitrososphaera sp. TaxID=1971748 RepID=UPI0017C0C3F3|nr:NAD(P)-binding domain-containing protein [Nitrososphaera sp.]NWG38175.1 potassium transporter TrkA [Nitrososphaera sp.]
MHHTNGNSKNERILVIGLGQIGYSNAEYMTSLGLHVDGFDISEKAIHRALRSGVIENAAKDFSNYDYYIICVSTHNPDDMFIPHLDGLFDVASRISREGKTGALVGIDSTITRGTTHKIAAILRHRLHVVHVPHRFYSKERQDHGVRQTRVAGGFDACCLEKAGHFYGEVLGIPLHQVRSAEIAELCKIVENSYRFMEIAFAEELKIFCDRSGLDFNMLKEAINTKWNVKILDAKDGIGGHCLPKDSQMFLNLERSLLSTSIIDAAKKVDSEYRLHLSNLPSISPVQLETDVNVH